MEYEEVLLIGGPFDGHRISLMKGMPTVKMAVPQNAPVNLRDSSLPPVPTTCAPQVYHRHPMHSSSGFVGAVYVADGVEPMAALIAGYRQPK